MARKRKQAKKKQSIFKRIDWAYAGAILKPFATLTVIALIGFAGMRAYQWLMLPTTFPLTHVQVQGELKKVDAGLLRDALKRSVNGGFFSIDLEQVAQSVESLPWVYRVSLRRMWPDRLMVVIEEQEAIANWGASSFLNKYGEIFRVPDFPNHLGLPRIVGTAGREKSLIESFVLADAALHPLNLKLVELREDARGDLRLILDNDIEIALGRYDHAARLERFKVAYEKTLGPVMSNIAALDLRYTNGFSVRWNRDNALITRTASNGI